MGRLLRAVFVLFVSLILSGFTLASEAAQKKVAVMPLEHVPGIVEQRAAEMMTELITVALANSGTYTVLERTQLAHAIKEINFQWSGMVDSSQAIEFGKMSGTDYTIVGKVLSANIFQRTSQNLHSYPLSYPDPFIGYGDLVRNFIPLYKSRVTLDVRFIDNTTGQIVFARVFEGAKAGNDKTACLNASCREAAEKVKIATQNINPLRGTVLESENGTVYIDKGFDSGIRKGETLIVFTEGKAIRAMNGEIIAVKSDEVGKIKVVKVNSNYSVCKIISGKEYVVRNAKVRRAR